MMQTTARLRSSDSVAYDRHLRVYEPASGRIRPTGRLHPSVYRRRRILAAGLCLLGVAVLLLLAQLIQAGIGGGPLSSADAAAGSPPMIAAGTRDYVVQPGDTLWTIAGRVDPNGDERPLVDALQRELGTTDIYPGEHIAIPSHW